MGNHTTETQAESTTWPGCFDRMEWADSWIAEARSKGFTLPRDAGAILHRIAIRDGTGDGCWEDYESMAQGLGIRQNNIGPAIKFWIAAGAVKRKRRQATSAILYPLVPSMTTTVQGGMPGNARRAARRLAWERLARSLDSCVSASHRSSSAGPNRSRGSISRTTR